MIKVRAIPGPPLTAQIEKNTQGYWPSGIKPILNLTVYLAGLLYKEKEILRKISFHYMGKNWD